MSYDLHQPASLDEALALAARFGEDAHLMAGGTALVLVMAQGLVRPAHVISLRKVRELHGVARERDGSLRIGAMATHRECELADTVGAHCAALAETFAHVATVRIRNQGTVGGNLAHADPAQDPPPMLIALGASAVAVGPNGTREIPLDSFFLDTFTTALAPGEILREVRVPALPAGARATYVKYLPRTQDDYATVSVAAVATSDGVRVALGGVGPTPVRARDVEDAVARGTANEEAAALVDGAIDPIDDARGSAAYKRDMARVWTARALRAVLS